MRRLRMMRRQTWRQFAPPVLVAAVMIGLIVDVEVGWRDAGLAVVLPVVLVAAACSGVHVRRLRAVRRSADAGIRSLELWLGHQGRGRRS
jgi:hypothetical protein